MGWTICILPSHASTKTSRTWKFTGFYSNASSKYDWKWKATWNPETFLHYQYRLMWALDIRMSCQNQDLQRKETCPGKIRHDIIKSVVAGEWMPASIFAGYLKPQINPPHHHRLQPAPLRMQKPKSQMQLAFLRLGRKFEHSARTTLAVTSAASWFTVKA